MHIRIAQGLKNFLQNSIVLYKVTRIAYNWPIFYSKNSRMWQISAHHSPMLQNKYNTRFIILIEMHNCGSSASLLTRPFALRCHTIVSIVFTIVAKTIGQVCINFPIKIFHSRRFCVVWRRCTISARFKLDTSFKAMPNAGLRERLCTSARACLCICVYSLITNILATVCQVNKWNWSRQERHQHGYLSHFVRREWQFGPMAAHAITPFNRLWSGNWRIHSNVTRSVQTRTHTISWNACINEMLDCLLIFQQQKKPRVTGSAQPFACCAIILNESSAMTCIYLIERFSFAQLTSNLF